MVSPVLQHKYEVHKMILTFNRAELNRAAQARKGNPGT